jgi:L-alanine-DL-glutamate epimerase-like enolase superfamily enzyme
MKIVDLKTHVLSIPLRQDEFPAPWGNGYLDQVVVELITDEGIVGYGEPFALGAPPATAAVIEHLLKPILIGADPAHLAQLHEEMYRSTHTWGRYGITTFAISGVDIALWDIAGKRAELPLYQLLGGSTERRIPAYASLVYYSDPEELHDVLSHAKRTGYGAMKLHQKSAESLSMARDILGDHIDLMVDVNCVWTPQEAYEKAVEFEPFGLKWLEEPIWPPEDFRNLAELGKRAQVPIALGENACTVYQFKEILHYAAATYLQPSVTKVGGLSELIKVATLVKAHNKILAPHSFYLGPGLLATAHLLAAQPETGLLEQLYAIPEATVFKEPLGFEEGYFRLPDGPGLGLDIDEKVLETYKRK